jgi:hypothetical protein
MVGSLAAQGDVTTWVADHRRHHAFATRKATRTPRGCSAPPRPRWAPRTPAMCGSTISRWLATTSAMGRACIGTVPDAAGAGPGRVDETSRVEETSG